MTVHPVGSAHLYGLIGYRVAHSLSPFIMNRALRRAELDAVYLRFDVAPDNLAGAVGGLTALGARGVNITDPFKESVLPLVEVCSPDSDLIGAVNTLVIRDGQIIGHNTEAGGVALALETVAKVSIVDHHILVLGESAAARAAAVGVLRRGAASVTFGVLSRHEPAAAIARLRDGFPSREIRMVRVRTAHNDFKTAFERADVVVNTFPVSMDGERSRFVDPELIRPSQCFFDFVYYPGSTEFLETARDRGACVLGGAALLVCEAVETFRQWTGQSFDACAMLEALEAAFPERSVI